MKEEACRLLEVDPDEVQLWDFFQGKVYGTKALDEGDQLNKRLKDISILADQDILILMKVCPQSSPHPDCHRPQLL